MLQKHCDHFIYEQSNIADFKTKLIKEKLSPYMTQSQFCSQNIYILFYCYMPKHFKVSYQLYKFIYLRVWWAWPSSAPACYYYYFSFVWFPTLHLETLCSFNPLSFGVGWLFRWNFQELLLDRFSESRACCYS